MRASLYLLLIFLLPVAAFAQSHSDDVIVLDNGDRLTGEIKGLDHGILRFKSDRALGTLEFDWSKVQRIQSKGRYEFELTSDLRMVGFIAPDPDSKLKPGEIALDLGPQQRLEIAISDILEIREMQKSFLGRVNLNVDAGITYTSGNQQTETNLSATLEFLRPKNSIRLYGSSLFSGQPGSDKTSRHEISFYATRYFSNKWDYIGLLAALHDNQQELDLRSTIGGGVRRTFVKTARTFFAGYSGFVYTRENYFDEDRNNGEILTGVSFSTYRFRSSEWEAYVQVFPSVSDPGRVRVDTNADWKWEIVSDLYWKVSLFDNYDSRPPVDADGNSFGITSSIGWSF